MNKKPAENFLFQLFFIHKFPFPRLLLPQIFILQQFEILTKQKMVDLTEERITAGKLQKDCHEEDPINWSFLDLMEKT